MKTKEEILESLKCCNTFACKKCSYKRDTACTISLRNDAGDLIEGYSKEIEYLRKELTDAREQLKNIQE